MLLLYWLVTCYIIILQSGHMICYYCIGWSHDSAEAKKKFCSRPVQTLMQRWRGK